MFKEKLAKMLESDNPIGNLGKKSEVTSKVEEFIKEKKAKAEEAPVFSKEKQEKSLTKEEKHDTIEDQILTQLKALTMLIEKYKGE